MSRDAEATVDLHPVDHHLIPVSSAPVLAADAEPSSPVGNAPHDTLNW